MMDAEQGVEVVLTRDGICYMVFVTKYTANQIEKEPGFEKEVLDLAISEGSAVPVVIAEGNIETNLNNSEKTQTTVNENTIISEGEHNHLAGNDGEEGAKTRWNRNEVKLLLAELKHHKDHLDAGRKLKKTYGAISAVLKKHGYPFDTNQVSNKVDVLRRKYKDVIDAEGTSGNGAVSWEWYGDMDDIFGNKKWARITSNTCASDGPRRHPMGADYDPNASTLSNEDEPSDGSRSSTSSPKFSRSMAPAKKQTNEILLDMVCERFRAEKRRKDEEREIKKEQREAARDRRHQKTMSKLDDLIKCVRR